MQVFPANLAVMLVVWELYLLLILFQNINQQRHAKRCMFLLEKIQKRLVPIGLWVASCFVRAIR